MDQIYTDIDLAVSRGDILPPDIALRILDSNDLDTVSLVHAAYRFRRNYFGKVVTFDVINNVQNGHCSEDCRYCAQSKTSTAAIKKYAMKSDEEILSEARSAYEAGAAQYCLVFSGKGPSDAQVDHIVELIKISKERWPIKMCLSPGMITAEQARKLKSAGLDWFHHNLNTSQDFYPEICTTHTYQDRLRTLEAARFAGLAVCSGVIVGMGEEPTDVIAMAVKLREIGVASIPVNFLIPIPGTTLSEANGLSPEYCLRVLCLFRFMNPTAEIRIAAGREMHLRSLQPLGLYVANSIFLNGYLNVAGASNREVAQMIADMGFSIASPSGENSAQPDSSKNPLAMKIKSGLELRPFKGANSI